MNHEKNLFTMAKAANVKLDEMLHSRSYPLPQLRNLMMADCYATGMTKKAIAAVFDKDRTTVFHGLKEAAIMREEPKTFKRVLIIYANYQQMLIESEMTKEECIEILSQFNEWRRYDGELGKGPEMIEPRVIGIAIDKAIDYIRETL